MKRFLTPCCPFYLQYSAFNQGIQNFGLKLKSRSTLESTNDLLRKIIKRCFKSKQGKCTTLRLGKQDTAHGINQVSCIHILTRRRKQRHCQSVDAPSLTNHRLALGKRPCCVYLQKRKIRSSDWLSCLSRLCKSQEKVQTGIYYLCVSVGLECFFTLKSFPQEKDLST